MGLDLILVLAAVYLITTIVIVLVWVNYYAELVFRKRARELRLRALTIAYLELRSETSVSEAHALVEIFGDDEVVKVSDPSFVLDPALITVKLQTFLRNEYNIKPRFEKVAEEEEE